MFRTYFRAKSLAKTVKDKYIDSATLTVYENGSGVNGSTIYVKPAAASFKCGTVTWNNQPGGTSANLASFKSKGSADAKHEINLKTWAQNVAKESGDGNKCYGLLFKAGSESSSSYVRFYGARASGHVPKLKVVYYDAPTTASAVTAKCSSDANRSYLKSGESLKVSWAGISAHALSYVQYRITDADGNTLSGHGYSTSTKIGTTASENATINVGDLKDGTYKVYARGVDKGGITGTGKSATFHIDKVKPVFTKFIIKESTNTNIYSDSEPELTYSVKDDNFYCVQVSVNNGSYKSLSDDKEISGLVSGQANTIKVRAVDKAGNVSDVKSFTYYYDEDAPVISASINPNTNSEKMDNSEKKPVLKYTISDKTLKSYEVELNGEKINVNGSSGEVELKNVEEGENNISITATDKAGNEEKQELTYYRDTVTPEAGSVKVTPKTGFFNTSNKLPIVSWNGFSDDNLSEIQIKINDGEYKTLGLDSSGEGQLQGVDFSKDGKYTLTVRAVDKGGNVSKEVSSNYYYETADYELDDYTPVNVYAVEQIGGNTILRFSTKSGKYRDDVEYQVYRSETPNVVINNKTFVKSYASKGSIKVSGDEGITYYYKLRTVKTTNEGTLYSDYSEEISSTTLNTNIIESRMGQNSMYTYASVSTPNGAGAVELSKGNFLYSQEDISLPAPQIPVNVVRVYNSKDESKSLMGYGWSQSYDMYVSEKGNTAYFIDGTKAVYTFIKSGDKFDCNETPDMSLEIDDDILKRTITKVTTDQFGKESTKTTDLEIDTHYKVTTKNGKTYRFDDCGKLLLIEETNGTFVYISYDNKNGNIKSVETSKGQVAQYAYNTEGFISKITAAQGTKSEYSYSYEYKDGYMTKAVFNGTGSDKIEYKYLYEDGKLIAITDAEGNQYKVSYDGQIITKFTYPNRESEKFEFTENQKVTQPKTKVKCCNSNGIRLSEEEYYFSLDGLITEKTDAAGNKETYTYDKKNKTLITDTTDSMKYYVLEGDVVVQRTVTNRENAEYDTYGNVTKSTDADGSITVYTYDYKNKIADVVRNQPVTMKTTDANGNTISYEYDEQGRILKVIEDGSVKATYSYDNLQKDNDGTYESVVETVTYANGGVAKTITNGSDQIISVKDETVSGNIETTYEYDNNGQVICEKYSDGSGIKYDYDVDGYQIRKSTYDAIDSKNAAKVTEYTYDTEGNILKAVDKKMGTPYRYTYYEYDSYGRNISVAEVNASSEPEVDTINAAKLKYVYNVDDNIEKIYYPNNKSDKLKGIQFVYNKDKWITEIDGLFSNDETVVIRQYVYHNDGKVKAIKDYENFLKKGSDFIERNYTYDVFDRVTTMKYFNSTDVDTILEQYDYQYDKNSNITYEHEVFNYENNVKDEEIRYTYNSLNQLTKSEKTDNITYKTTTSSYQYDSVGNRTYEGVFEFYTVDEMQSEITGSYKHSNYNVLNQLRSATRIESEDGKNVKTYNYSYRYDEEGNQVEVNDGKTGTTTTYEYDVENQLIYVRIEKNGTKVSEEHNEYNGAGQRIKKIDITVTDSGKEETKTTCYYYEGSLLLYTTNENGVKTSQNIIGNQNNAFATIRYDGDKQSEYFYSKDVQGSVTNLIDNSETCSKSYNYTDFGETEERFESEVDNEICYTGGVYDELTGLYYLNVRYYDSDDGNFLSQDTYRGGNLYGYCGGNPISYIDPSGHSAVVVSGGAYKKSKKGYYYEFIETALCQLKNWGKSKGKKYWFIAKRGWSKSDKKAFKKQAKKCGAVKPIYFKSTKKLISKLNSKKFKKDKISDFTVFAHGFPGKITFGYNYTDGTDNDKLTMKCSQIKKISKDSFVTYPTSIFYSCRTAATDDNGKNNFAKKWNKRFGGGTIAFEGRTDYSEINYLPGYSWWDMHLYERKHGGKKFRTPARQLPTGINEKIYSNIKGDFPNSSYYCC